MASQTTEQNNDSNLPHPAVIWAQRKDVLWVTVKLEGCTDPVIDLQKNKLNFRGVGGTDKKMHAVSMEFYGEVSPDDSKYTVGGREIIFVIKKKDSDATFWPRLLKQTDKVHYLKTDFDRWRDEDDSEEDDASDLNLEQMMNSMGGLGQGGMNEPDQEDSDDDDLPDLE